MDLVKLSLSWPHLSFSKVHPKDKKEITKVDSAANRVQGFMLTETFQALRKDEQASRLLKEGEKHLHCHYKKEGDNQLELGLAISFFEEASRLGNEETREAIEWYNQGLKYWYGSEYCSVNKKAAIKCMVRACDLGLFAADDWCQKNDVYHWCRENDVPVPSLVVKIGDDES